MITLDTETRAQANNPKPVARLSAANPESARTASAANTSTNNTGAPEASSAPAPAAEFSALLQELIGPSKEISEEELFAGLLQERIINSKGIAAGMQFRDLLEQQKLNNVGPDGSIGYEEAANAALDAFVSSGALSKEEAQRLHAQSFGAAQLDNNKYLLWDGKGSDYDQTIAVASIEQALLSARGQLDLYAQGLAVPATSVPAADPNAKPKVESGSTAPVAGTAPKTDPAASATEEQKAAEEKAAEEKAKEEAAKAEEQAKEPVRGLSFRPRSAADDHVLVRLPEHLAKKIKEVRILDADGNTIEVGSPSGPGKKDARERFRFAKAGDEYPTDIRVEAELANGATRSWKIQDAKQRYEGLAGTRGKKKAIATS